MRKVVGKVSSEEKEEILKLFERRNGLLELVKILTVNDNELYDKVVMDIGVTNIKFQNWWDEMSKKYNWESAVDGNWEIDFQTCEIYLVTV